MTVATPKEAGTWWGNAAYRMPPLLNTFSKENITPVLSLFNSISVFPPAAS